MLPRAACNATFITEEENDDDTQIKDLQLRPDHASRPVYMSGDKRVFLETFLSHLEAGLHEYRVTDYALYAAVSVGLDSESIIKALGKLCKKLRFQRRSLSSFEIAQKAYGKAKLVLKKGDYFVQTMEENVMRIWLSHRKIAFAEVPRSESDEAKEMETEQNDLFMAGREEAVSDAKTLQALAKALKEEEEEEVVAFADEKKEISFEFEVPGEKVEHVKRQAFALEYPLIEEYDFRNDTANQNIDLDLKPIAKILPYQEKSLQKMFKIKRAR
ncbi:Helicase [Gracilaria domingensis]|nr:Helicase [Gracilaria domingensis]